MVCLLHLLIKSAAQVESFFYDAKTNKENHPSAYVNVIMAQSLVKSIPPFCLMMYGTNNSYTATDVDKRWDFIVAEMDKCNIKVVSIGTDSDPKYNSLMRKKLLLGQENEIELPQWFNTHLTATYIPFQDTVHIGTKLRNRLLNQDLRFGKNIVSFKHLLALVKKFPKTDHKLTETSIYVKDRMNFDTVLKICDSNVISMLDSSVADSHGTVLFLRMVSNILRSYLDLSLTPLERVRAIWVSIFLLRIWRLFILENKQYQLKNHFITSYAYICVEINAHSLIFMILKLKEGGQDEFFHTELYGSQQCEATFRQIRSLSSTYSTVTDCSLVQIMSRVSKIQLQNEITHVRLKHLNFPRIGLPATKSEW